MSEILEKGDQLLEKKDLLRLFDHKITKRTIDYLVVTGQIPFIRFGKRRVLFSKNRLQQWIREQENVQVKYDK